VKLERYGEVLEIHNKIESLLMPELDDVRHPDSQMTSRDVHLEFFPFRVFQMYLRRLKELGRWRNEINDTDLFIFFYGHNKKCKINVYMLPDLPEVD
jgi:hypothetical protein